MIYRTLFSAITLICTAIFTLIPTTTLAEVEMAVSGDNQRMVAKQITAVITSIDREARTITVEGPLGNALTLTGAGDGIERIDEFAVGDFVTATYVSSMSSELRTPTAEELAEPWVEVDAAARADMDMEPGAAVGRMIRAVCTIEGMNRVTGTVTLQDPKGNFHIIGDVDPAKMAGVTLGDTVVVTYSEAVALTLEKQQAAE
jgi:Cu/Ag efflux protein CusF